MGVKYVLLWRAAFFALSSQTMFEHEACTFDVAGIVQPKSFRLERGENEIGDVCKDRLDGKLRCPSHCRQEVDATGATVPPYCVAVVANSSQLQPCRVYFFKPKVSEVAMNASSGVHVQEPPTPLSLPEDSQTSEDDNATSTPTTKVYSWLKRPQWRPPDWSRAGRCATDSCWSDQIAAGFDQVFNLTDFTSTAKPVARVQVPTTVHVVASSPGKWSASEECPTPKLWVFLFGQYRSFDRTRDSLREMVEHSAGSCYFVSAVTAEESGIPLNTKSSINDLKGGWEHDVDVVERMVDAQSSIFGYKMAYAVVQRTGKITRLGSLEGLLNFFWYSVYMTSRLAAEYHHFIPRTSSFVIRTRFDLFYDAHFDLVPITAYFETGDRGEYLGFAQEAVNSQSDYYMMTSYGAYARHLAGAYERGMYLLAVSNGWGIGFSLCGFHEGCNSGAMKGPSVDLSPECRAKDLPYNNECCPANEPCMMTFVRAKKIFGNSFIQRTNFTLKVSPSSINDTVIDLTKDITLYCPVDIHGKSCGGGGTRLRYTYCSKDSLDLNSPPHTMMKNTKSLWPSGC